MTAIMRPKEAAAYLGLSPDTLRTWCYLDRGQLLVGGKIRGPKWVDSPTGRRLGYLKDDLDAWLKREVAA